MAEETPPSSNDDAQPDPLMAAGDVVDASEVTQGADVEGMMSNADAAAEADALLAEVAAAGESVVGQANSLIANADQLAIDELLKQANFEDPSVATASEEPPAPDTSNFELPNFQQVMQDAQVSSI